MKVLIVEDSKAKKESIIRVLEKNGITDYCVEKSVNGAIKTAISTKFDFLITDLGLPQLDDTRVTEAKAGLKMLLRLAHRNIRIPTVIYSTTLVSEEETENLKRENYPMIAQIMDSEVLQMYLKQK